MGNERLPDVPWHVGFAKKKEDDPRRHKARCIHIDTSGQCLCSKAGAFMCKCGGSAHCIYYAENINQMATVKNETQTVEEEAAERIERYKKSLEKKRDKICKNVDDPIHFVNLEKMIKCQICDERVIKKYSSMYCDFCGTYYAYENQIKECKNLNKIEDGKIVIIFKRKKEINEIRDFSRACEYSGTKNKCRLKSAKRYGRQCMKKECTEYVPVKFRWEK